MKYDQKKFATALETAGFRADKQIYERGALFFNSTHSNTQRVTVSLYQWHYTATFQIMTKEGFKVKDHISFSIQEAEFLAKAREWGIQ